MNTYSKTMERGSQEKHVLDLDFQVDLLYIVWENGKE